MKRQWIKDRWLDFRFGMSYVAVATGIYQILILTALVLGIRGAAIFYLATILTPPFVITALVIGAVHRKYQLETDMMKGAQPVLEEIRKIVSEEIKKELAE